MKCCSSMLKTRQELRESSDLQRHMRCAKKDPSKAR
jgi:hypothetical protein